MCMCLLHVHATCMHVCLLYVHVTCMCICLLHVHYAGHRVHVTCVVEDLPESLYELANDRSAHQRASGWKLQHFSSQLQEQVRIMASDYSMHTLMSGMAPLASFSGQGGTRCDAVLSIHFVLCCLFYR